LWGCINWFGLLCIIMWLGFFVGGGFIVCFGFALYEVYLVGCDWIICWLFDCLCYYALFIVFIVCSSVF